MPSNVVAIDGPAASGKSTIAKLLAARLKAQFVSTGAMYRAIAWKANRLPNLNGHDSDFNDRVGTMLRTTTLHCLPAAPGTEPEIEIDGLRPGPELRTPQVSKLASRVAVIPEVRHFLVDIQRRMADSAMLVMEGRDIGTAVFPDAKYKFFLTASPRIRAMRRLSQGGEAPDGAQVDAVAAEIEARDRQDTTRALDPLKQAADAVLVDNSTMTIEQTLDAMLTRIRLHVL